MFFTLRHKVNDLAYVLASVFISSLKPRENSICCVSRWVRGEKTGVGVGGVALSVSLLLNVTGKIGKAFNVMQYLSNHPIKIRPNQSLPADWACTILTPALLNLRTADVHHVHLQRVKESLGFFLHFAFHFMQLCVLLLFCTRDEESVFHLSLWHHNIL